jgi:hypothetical protein
MARIRALCRRAQAAPGGQRRFSLAQSLLCNGREVAGNRIHEFGRPPPARRHDARGCVPNRTHPHFAVTGGNRIYESRMAGAPRQITDSHRVCRDPIERRCGPLAVGRPTAIPSRARHPSRTWIRPLLHQQSRECIFCILIFDSQILHCLHIFMHFCILSQQCSKIRNHIFCILFCIFCIFLCILFSIFSI